MKIDIKLIREMQKKQVKLITCLCGAVIEEKFAREFEGVKCCFRCFKKREKEILRNFGFDIK